MATNQPDWLRLQASNNGLHLLSAQGNHCTYRLPEGMEQGLMRCAELFHGVELCCADVRLAECAWKTATASPDILIITHCREGRLEYAFQDGSCAFLGPGDLAIYSPVFQTEQCWLPSGRFWGISVILHPEQCAQEIAALSTQLLGETIDLHTIFRCLCDTNCTLIRRSPDTEAIFAQLYQKELPDFSGYFRLKLLELLLFLSGRVPEQVQHEPVYLYQDQVKRVKEMQQYLVRNLSRHITQDALARQFHLSLTSLKQCFKAVYGLPVDTYMRTYRIHQAQQLLRETNLPVAEIAQQVGYESHSRFTAVFKAHTGLAPLAYRKVSLRRIQNEEDSRLEVSADPLLAC